MGKTQQAVLDRLADAEHGNLTVTALAKRVGVSIRRILSAVHALEERGRVCISRDDSTSEWTGRYGDLTIASNVRLRSGGMPPKPLLIVWLPERRADFVADWLSTTAARGGSGSPEMVPSTSG